MEAGCGQRRMSPAAPYFSSPCQAPKERSRIPFSRFTGHESCASQMRLALFLSSRVTKRPGCGTERMAEMTRQMALVRKACGIRDFGQRQFRLRQQCLGQFQALLRKVMVRCDAGGLLKLPRKMMH